MNLNTPQKISLAFYIFLLIFWVALFFTNTTEGFYNYFYSFLFGLIPLIAGIVAIFSAKRWGGVKTAIGKAVFFVGLGILFWGAGEMIWSYYNFFLGVPAPYPSVADLGFAPSIFFYGLGAFYLSKVTGAKYGLRSKTAKVFVTIAPFAILAASYYLLVVVARGGVLVPEGETPLKIVLDIAYPLGDFLSLAVAVIISGLSFQYMGGRHTGDIVAILLGLGVMFLGDTAFSYATTVGTYYNANWGDLLLTTGTFLLSLGVLGFYKLKEVEV
ncbi:MAG: hypothetical protein HYZ61_02030 [Candidatus Andersenbacteria bacterium]|nr:hypothetical protein [Candidatus Andersenbacteria bacterium]